MPLTRSPGFCVGAGAVQGGCRAARTQGSPEAPTGSCWEEREPVGGFMGQGWTVANQWRRFGEVKCEFAFTAAFSALTQQAGHEPPRHQKGCFPRTGPWEEGAFRACTYLSPHKDTLVAPCTLHCKARSDPLHLRLEKTELVAWHHLHLTFQLSALWGAGRDLLISTAQARLAAAAQGSASPGWSRQRAAGMHRQVSAESLYDFKYISKATNTVPKCCRHSQADK